MIVYVLNLRQVCGFMHDILFTLKFIDAVEHSGKSHFYALLL